jgi:hypothetical protein
MVEAGGSGIPEPIADCKYCGAKRTTHTIPNTYVDQETNVITVTCECGEDGIHEKRVAHAKVCPSFDHLDGQRRRGIKPPDNPEDVFSRL